MAFVLVGNVPPHYHAKDLRNFFSEYIESGAFACFHFRHRKVDTVVRSMVESQDDSTRLKSGTLCALCKVESGFLSKFISKYNNAIWRNYENEYSYANNVMVSSITSADTLSVVAKWIELNPPTMLPQGNVGTPLEFFKQNISSCRMPVNVLKRLGICSSLLINRSINVYGRVQLNYEETFGEVTHSRCNENYSQYNCSPTNKPTLKFMHQSHDEDQMNIEEWDRYEALHNDVDEQQRTKPRLYEQPMEVVWEKGGSGLVFHTDDVTWKELEGKMDFDEDTADDWDVDTEIYTANESDVNQLLEKTPEGQLLNLKIMKHLKKGIPQSRLLPPSSSFKISKFATNQMKKYGWKRGQSLGKNNTGIKSAITPSFRRSDDKSGLGSALEENDYDDVALTNYLQMRKLNKPRKHFIATVYDQNSTQSTTPWKSDEPTLMKYIDKDKR